MDHPLRKEGRPMRASALSETPTGKAREDVTALSCRMRAPESFRRYLCTKIGMHARRYSFSNYCRQPPCRTRSLALPPPTLTGPSWLRP